MVDLNPFPSVSSVQSVQFIPFLSLSIRIIRPIRTAYSPSACCRRRSLMAVVAASAAAKSNSIHGSPIGNSSLCSPGSPGVMNPRRIFLPGAALADSSSTSSGDSSPARSSEVEVIGINLYVTTGASAARTSNVWVLICCIGDVLCQGLFCAPTGSRHTNSMPATTLIILCFMVFMLFYLMSITSPLPLHRVRHTSYYRVRCTATRQSALF